MMVATGFSPGGGQSGVSKAFVARDAADLLLSSTTNSESMEASGRGVLLLADGSRYEGDLFGAQQVAEGELVFTTNMTGYQESLTDPSFAGHCIWRRSSKIDVTFLAFICSRGNGVLLRYNVP